jgi:hypothetical protein
MSQALIRLAFWAVIKNCDDLIKVAVQAAIGARDHVKLFGEAIQRQMAPASEITSMSWIW